MVVEKPFGRDLASSTALDVEMRQTLGEEQIYRIDHYLGKETVQNILMFRFANAVFEPIWNRNYIDHVQIIVAERLGVEHRAGYYEQAGLLRDMFQNHMMQMLAMVAMEPPTSFHADRIRDEKTKLFKAIRPFDLGGLDRSVVRGQYAAGEEEGKRAVAYRDEPGVAKNSQVDTYVAAKLMIDNWRWQGVPFYLRSGKRLSEKMSEIAIVFKEVPHSMFTPLTRKDLAPNMLILNVQPKEGISLRVEAKHPGEKLCINPLFMKFSYEEVFGSEPPDAYERLLLDCLLGDQTLFVRGDGMTVAWQLVTPLLTAWERNPESNPLAFYPCGSWGPKEADDLIGRDGREWIVPRGL